MVYWPVSWMSLYRTHFYFGLSKIEHAKFKTLRGLLLPQTCFAWDPRLYSVGSRNRRALVITIAKGASSRSSQGAPLCRQLRTFLCYRDRQTARHDARRDVLPRVVPESSLGVMAEYRQ